MKDKLQKKKEQFFIIILHSFFFFLFTYSSFIVSYKRSPYIPITTSQLSSLNISNKEFK